MQKFKCESFEIKERDWNIGIHKLSKKINTFLSYTEVEEIISVSHAINGEMYNALLIYKVK